MDLIKDLYNNGKLYRLSMDPSGIDISGENQIINITSDQITGDLNVNGDISLNGDLSTNGDVNINTTSAIKISNGTTSERPTNSLHGQIRYNNDIDHYEGYRKISEILSHWEQFVLPAGAVQHFAMQTAPSGWLICDGSNVLQSYYPKLYAAIGNIYGTPTGDNAANEFLLPDFRGRFIRGWDDMGQGSGGNDVDATREFGSTQDDENKSHNHTGSTANENRVLHGGVNSHRFGNANEGRDGSQYGPYYGASIYDNQRNPGLGPYGFRGEHSHNLTITNDGTESRPKNIALLICIKY